MQEKLDKVEPQMRNFHSNDFNIFDFAELAGRPHVIKLTTLKALKDLELFNMVQNDTLLAFLRKISKTYI